jgi:hypothetical protein
LDIGEVVLTSGSKWAPLSTRSPHPEVISIASALEEVKVVAVRNDVALVVSTWVFLTSDVDAEVRK